MEKEKGLIYIVEDDLVYANIIISLLKKDNLEFKHFLTGESFFEMLKEESPDICVLDFNLNSEKENAMNGLQIMQIMKKENYDIPTIILSGLNDVQLAIDTLKYNASDYIVKNEQASVKLEKVIHKILDLKTDKKTSDYHKSKSDKLRKRIVLTFSIVLLLLITLLTFN